MAEEKTTPAANNPAGEKQPSEYIAKVKELQSQLKATEKWKLERDAIAAERDELKKALFEGVPITNGGGVDKKARFDEAFSRLSKLAKDDTSAYETGKDAKLLEDMVVYHDYVKETTGRECFETTNRLKQGSKDFFMDVNDSAEFAEKIADILNTTKGDPMLTRHELEKRIEQGIPRKK